MLEITMGDINAQNVSLLVNSIILPSSKTFCKLEIALSSECGEVGIENELDQRREKWIIFCLDLLISQDAKIDLLSCNGGFLQSDFFKSKEQCPSLPISRIIQLPGFAKKYPFSLEKEKKRQDITTLRVHS